MITTTGRPGSEKLCRGEYHRIGLSATDHVENGKHFVIRNIKARNINAGFSKKAGIDNATVAIYGCDNFVIDNIEMINSAGMLIGYGVIKGKYRLEYRRISE